MEHALGQEFVSVVEKAAIACAHTMGLGDRRYSDQVATESMRKALHEIPMDGTIVIGEGERDEAPMLFIGEKVGDTSGSTGVPVVDIAVDPLEGTNLCATGANNAIAVIAASDQGGLLHAPDCYMEKIIVGPSSRGAIDIDAPVKQNLKAIAKRLDRGVDDLVVIVLDRPRHAELIKEIRQAGARIRLIGDGDLSAGISAAVVGTGVHAVMGTGGAPEGVLTAAALRCLNGEMQARLVVAKPDQEKRLKDMGVEDLKKVYTTEELAPGDRMIFAACGVTDGTLLKGVRFFGGGARTHTLIMTLQSRKARFIDTVHLERRPDFKVRF
ncbi:MAG: class II fructose-bisphosphatase [Acidobacteria bacterium]|nr:MAG: class II fructose-bisphosphatase [Acidobacteriota bacterium]PYU99430.1 MAG: class II fructose-bisphosphatase [Acidobacteriota bacterium]